VEFMEIIEEGTAEPTVSNITLETMPNDNLVSVTLHKQTKENFSLDIAAGKW
jgi:hypothetical protein